MKRVERRSSLLRSVVPFVGASAVAFALVEVSSSPSLYWLWTDEVGRPLAEELLSFWKWRLPVVVGLGVIVIGALAATPRPVKAHRAILVAVLAVMVSVALGWRLYAGNTGRTMRGVAVLLFAPVDAVREPPVMLSFFGDKSDPAGVATESPAMVAQFAGCYQLLRNVGKVEWPLRLLSTPIDTPGLRFRWPRRFLAVEGATNWEDQFWEIRNGSAVVHGRPNLAGTTTMIRRVGTLYEAIDGHWSDIHPTVWVFVPIERVSCENWSESIRLVPPERRRFPRRNPPG